MNRGRAQRAFSLLEVIIALAMLALIAVPAIGLATMAVSRSKEQLKTGAASQLKNRLDIALRAYGTGAVFTDAFIPSDSDLAFLASEDLEFLELASGTISDDNDRFYRIVVKEPNGYVYSEANDSYRLIVYEVSWPNNTVEPASNQLFFTTVFRK